MLTTPNLGLKKPEANDTVNIADLNYNADVLDEQVAKRIVNSGGVPSIQAGLDTDKPVPGTVGRLYIATDTQIIYRDTGTAWQKVGVVKWDDIEGKPSSFPPSAHKSTHAIGGSDALSPADIGAETPAGAQAKVNTHASSKQTHGISGSYYIAKTSRSDQLPAWNDIQSKPSSFTPSNHASTHKTGGTDVITPADIGAAVNVVYTATIQAANWSGSEAPFSQSVSVSGILSTDTPIIDVVMSGTYGTDIERSSQWNYVYRAVTGANSITFYAKTKPTIDLPIQIKVVR